MRGKRTRALDSRGRPVSGLYVRDGRFIAGYQCPQTRRWRMTMLHAETLTEARRERDSLLAGLREARVAAPAATTLAAVFSEYQAARSLAERTRTHERHLFERHLGTLASRRPAAARALRPGIASTSDQTMDVPNPHVVCELRRLMGRAVIPQGV